MPANRLHSCIIKLMWILPAISVIVIVTHLFIDSDSYNKEPQGPVTLQSHLPEFANSLNSPEESPQILQTCKPCQQCEKCGPTAEEEAQRQHHCRNLLKEKNDVNSSDYKIQLIAATPGSGNDWCMLTLKYMTGLSTGSVYHYSKLKSVEGAPTSLLYYHTHFPFLRHYGVVGEYLSTNPEKVIILIRNPLDAGFSEFVRQTIAKLHNGTAKYSNADKVFVEASFMRRTPSASGDTLRISTELHSHLKEFLNKWKAFHNYWLNEYKGATMVVLYSDLLKDMSTFENMAKFLGYDPHLTEERKTRLKCLYDNASKTSFMRRKRTPAIDDSKEPVRSLFRKEIEEVTTYVSQLYKNKFNQTIDIV